MEYGNCYLENMHFGLCNRQLACHRESELYPIEFQKPMSFGDKIEEELEVIRSLVCD